MMGGRFTNVLTETLRDLGITVVYATFAGLGIAAIAASDGTSLSALSCVSYVGFLPLVVLALIGGDAALRTFSDWRSGRLRV